MQNVKDSLIFIYAVHITAPESPEGARFLESVPALGRAIWEPGDRFWSRFLTGLCLYKSGAVVSPSLFRLLLNNILRESSNFTMWNARPWEKVGAPAVLLMAATCCAVLSLQMLYIEHEKKSGIISPPARITQPCRRLREVRAWQKLAGQQIHPVR